ncbi:large subunit ribosomal protein L3 [Keratinibaculum paraultunense]|uniref:Large ribosomal subunit protein uL3 n=1 Tax=Keratinibaculum paraultunense TaxID=1278232 RepID=A0A4R3KPY0_9FIRM|nr:50S ribosomal protein L3 [Keratinibaculum paraultunense]QQY79414.1 50S ribosomal protein L3 [Keratinibaculum paraultunense]TCS86162.1 large subunit ribosomal protein L3 [Keratinibaculum paraultunense]
MKNILGKKIGMTQIFLEDGAVVPVTVIEAGPVKVIQKKTVDKEGYNAVQVGFEDAKENRVNKPLKGHFDKAEVEYKKHIKEFIVDNPDEFEVGQEIKVDVFEQGDKVDVIGISKGKGTQGPIKRHNYSRGPESHGSKYHRAGGARAAAADPGRVFKGTKGMGRMGNERVTVQNLEIVRVDVDRNLLLIKGAVPGPKGGLLFIKETVKNK